MKLLVAALLLFAPQAHSDAQTAATPIRVAIVGLVHGHVQGFLQALPGNRSATLVAIVEPDTKLAAQYQASYHLDPALFSTDLERTLTTQKPDAVLVYTTIRDHRRVIEAAAARVHHVSVLVNYETTWYASNAEALAQVGQGRLGDIRKVVVHDGHEGPAEIGVGPEWLPWLTDPAQNGAGALFDFGCYGADLLTVMMRGAAPVSVTAVVQTDKPALYPHVDDDATVILRYPKAQAVLMPSWNWTFSRKDMEVYGTGGTAITVGADRLRNRFHGEKTEVEAAAPPLPADRHDSLGYLAAVLHGQLVAHGDLSALDTNVVVMQILDAARQSAASGKTVTLPTLPQ